FDGDIILAQNGVLMAKNKRFSMLPYQLLTAEINPENFDESRRKNFSDSTEKFKEFTGAVTLGLFDYLRKTKVNGFTLSLSGGADSAACAVLVSEMVKRGILHLGTERFLESLNLN